MTSCFLEIPPDEWVAQNSLAFAVRDRFPVSPGHTLVITRRVITTWFEATRDEHLAVLELVDAVKSQLDEQLQPAGYNVGFNAGVVAGQTVMHLHVHVIPRYPGDVEDPRGGVRHVIPSRGNYLRPNAAALATGGTADPFISHLRPLFAEAQDIAIVAAFVQDSGMSMIRGDVFAALDRGARVQLLTGDYLNITQAEALEEMLDWTSESAVCSTEPDLEEQRRPGTFEGRVVEVAGLGSGTRAFHPKSWRFEGPTSAAAFVGSSNLSHSALATGIEWNLRVDRHRDPGAYRQIVEAFDALWKSARPLTAEWVSEYARRARAESMLLPAGEAEAETAAPPPPPHPLQQEALDALAASRVGGRERALVVLATGLGKTWLAAFDVEAFRRERGTWPRVLFLAHRSELLAQAAETFRRLLRSSGQTARFGWFVGDRADLDADLVFASVQKLARPENLERLAAQAFDYVIVDEVHHAAAQSYRQILARLEPVFLLGLTATPERADEGDVLGLFDDHLAYRADLGIGIENELLVPFAYYGLRDDVDYANIPWRNKRFDPGVLAAAVQTEARMQRLLRTWHEHPATRTLVFCCSVTHAEYARDWLRTQGIRTEAVFSGPGSADRASTLRALTEGAIDALCAVDLFNEGVDLPLVDRVVMLRPTESSVIFLQQLGRGLRRADGKQALTVIDFVGNHRVFLNRLRTLLSLGPAPETLHAFLAEDRPPDLPEGCSVELELEAKDLLRSFLPTGRSEVERIYREIFASRGERATPAELFHMGYRPSTLIGRHGSWFDFVAREGHLTDGEARALDTGRAWFQELETTAMTKCFKMLVVEVLLDAEALRDGMPVGELAERCHAVLARSPELFRDLEGVKELGNPRTPDPTRWLTYWRDNPIKAWLGRGAEGGRWFRLDGDRLMPALPVEPGDEASFVKMTRELVEYRLAQYRARNRTTPSESSFECKIVWNQRDPILKLPSRKQHAWLPEGQVPVRLPDGTAWQFKLAKEFCNVARPPNEQRNRLPDLLRGWFGPAAGHPGTAFSARFSRSPDAWWIEPVGGRVIDLAERRKLVAYPSLRAAAGSTAGAIEDAPEAETVRLPTARAGTEVFAVRAAGDSMNGGKNPIRDGDWLVMRLARGVGLGSLRDRVALVQMPDDRAGYVYQVKRIVKDGTSWTLHSDNPGSPSFPATEETVPIAVVEEVVHPEDLAPVVGGQLDGRQAADLFSLDGTPRTGRYHSHLLVCIEERGHFVEPDRMRYRLEDRRPGETAFVLARPAGQATWRYCGVARWQPEEELWALPDLDYATWRALGVGRGCSRRLPENALGRAHEIIRQLLERFPPGAFVEAGERRCRLVGPAAGGGLRIDGGPDGFAERTISPTDFAWVLVGHDAVSERGGLLDEARVNRLRYLDGTPSGSTRFIDTGWALALSRTFGIPGEGTP